MLIGILGDCHFDFKRNSDHFDNLNARFYQEILFPTLRQRGIKHVVQTGDLFHYRKTIDINNLNKARKYFFDEFKGSDLELITYTGNHDAYWRNTLSLNSPELILGEYIENIWVITEPTTWQGMDFIPWICEENETSVKKFMAKSKSQICFGHFELQGFEMESGMPCNHGMSREELKQYDMVISGHFHHRSSDGHIFYVGSPTELTWADYDDPRGFHIFDTDTRQLEFIENSFKMFYKIEYNETNETMESIDAKNYSEYKGKIVKVVVKNKKNLLMFDRFMDNFHKAEPADLGVVEDFTDYSQAESLMEEGLDQAEHTHVLLDKYVDSIDMELDKDKMKFVMRKIYNEAQMVET